MTIRQHLPIHHLALNFFLISLLQSSLSLGGRDIDLPFRAAWLAVTHFQDLGAHLAVIYSWDLDLHT